jgi:hypothetical protein
MIMQPYVLDNEKHTLLQELLEDSISWFCDEYKISGELAWVVAECFAKAKQEDYKIQL